MTDEQAANAIKTQWLAAWPALSAAVVAAEYPSLAVDGVPGTFDNEGFAEPEPPVPWYEHFLEHGTTEQYTMGKPAKHLTRGILYIVLRWPAAGLANAAEGTSRVYKLAKAVRDAISVMDLEQGVGEDGVHMRETQIRDNGQGGAGLDGRWWILAALTPFEYTEIR